MRKTSEKLLFIFTLALSGALNLLSWTLPGFSDRFTDNVFPVLTSPYARFTSLFPFSVGELLIIAGLIWLTVLAVFLTAGLILRIIRSLNRRRAVC